MFTVDQSLVFWSDKQLCEVLVYFTGDLSLVSWSDKQRCEVLVYFTGDLSLGPLSDKQLCEVLVCLQVIRAWYPGLINNTGRFWYILQVT